MEMPNDDSDLTIQEIVLRKWEVEWEDRLKAHTKCGTGIYSRNLSRRPEPSYGSGSSETD